MADGFFHLEYDPCVPTQNAARLSGALKAARESSSDDVRHRMTDQFDQRGSQIREAWLAVLTKFGVLEVVNRRLERKLGMLLQDLARNEAKARACAAAPDTAYPLEDPLPPIQLVESVDAFIFQHRSAYEMLGGFIREFCRIILASPVPWNRQEVLERIAEVAGADTAWIHTLRLSRHYFAHDRSPWMGVWLVEATGVPEVVILKSDVSTPSEPEGFLTLEQITSIHRGFHNAVCTCVDWLIHEIESQEGG